MHKNMKDNSTGNIETYPDFQTARDVKRAKLKILKAGGKGNRPNRSAAIRRDQEEKLYGTGKLGYSTLISLLRSVCRMVTITTMLFGHRERNESRQMLWGYVTLQKGENGKECLEISERLTKTRGGGEGDGGSRAFRQKAFDNRQGQERCPVTTYKEYSKSICENA